MNITNILELSGLLLQTGLVALLINRSAHRTFPVFFSYTLFAIIIATTKFLVRQQPLAYFYVYWSAEAAYALLGFAALYEAYYRLFRSLYYNPRIRYAFPATALLMLTISAIWMWLHGLPRHAIPLLRVIFTMEFGVALLQFGFFALIILLAVYHSDSTRFYGYGIAAGFGIVALGVFADAVVFSEFGLKYKNLLNFLSPVAYFVAVLVWLHAFARPEPTESSAQYRRYDPWQVLEQLRQLRKNAKETFGSWFDLLSFRSGAGSP